MLYVNLLEIPIKSKYVYRIVNNYNGSVNKINFFDKDLLILVIFGFRRFKLDSECAVALKCSTECQHALFQIPGVRKVSIGVTTGDIIPKISLLIFILC